MGLTFGTSGIRGLETELTDQACSRLARAFIRHFRSVSGNQAPQKCIIGGDLRRSTPRILAAVAKGLSQEGITALDAGILPTPALAHECLIRKTPGIMITGSHIPADRNGIKFYFPWGEVLKKDEAPILEHDRLLSFEETVGGASLPTAALVSRAIPAQENYVARYTQLFPKDALKGLRLCLYEHSTAARDALGAVLEGLGAEVVRFGRTDEFLPVDTEALNQVAELAAQLRQEKGVALISADGDGDRPLLLEETGSVVRGDQLGILAALALEADFVATPVSTSTSLEKTQAFPEIQRTRIGSPFVIEAMEEAKKRDFRRIVGFEANGGFLVGSDLALGNGTLGQLPTRDCLLPVLLVLVQAARSGQTVSKLVAQLPPRFTASRLIRNFPQERSQSVLERLQADDLSLLARRWKEPLGTIQSVQRVDGVRVEFSSGDILHFRPSGNAPEFRIYTESLESSRAEALGDEAQAWISSVC